MLLVPIGVLLGLSAFVAGLYDTADWGIATVVALALVVAVTVAGLPRLRPRAVVALAAVGGIWVWSWLSTMWAESSYQALEGANRWLLYAALLAALLLLVRDQRIGLALLGAATVGILVTALYVVSEMSGAQGRELFLGGRLTEPLGYVNGQAAYFFVGVWPLLALAETTRRSWLGGLAVAGCVLLGGLVVLAQTRALVPGVLVTAGVVLVIVPGRLRRLAALACVAGGVALALDPLLDVYRDVQGAPTPAELDSAARALLTGAAVTGVLWAALDFAVGRASAASPHITRSLSRVATVALAAVAGLGLVGAGIKAGTIADRVDEGYHDFVNLETAIEGESRFTSGGGARYDYWRVAWNEFRERPLAGYGAGNYDRGYFASRRTTEDITQPHSIELQTLAELGLVGGALLVAFAVAVSVGLARAARTARTSRSGRLVAVGAGGAFLAWLSHTSVDWLHVIPGLTAIALVAATVLLAPRRRQRRLDLRLRLELLVLAGVVLVAIVGGLSAGRQAASERARERSVERLVSDPDEALRMADRAVQLNDQSVQALISKSAAHARLGDYAGARSALLDATALEPHDFVPWGLLGDIAVRRGDLATAARAYRRARRLNPRDPFLGALADDPQSAIPFEGAR